LSSTNAYLTPLFSDPYIDGPYRPREFAEFIVMLPMSPNCGIGRTSARLGVRRRASMRARRVVEDMAEVEWMDGVVLWWV
jgi:hypothetical protein